MQTLLTALAVVVVAVFLVGGMVTTSHGVCIFHCPAGDGFVSPGLGKISIDQDSDGDADIVDLAVFASAYPPQPYHYCSDFNCDGVIGLVDVAILGAHYGHIGTPGFCQPQIDHYKPYEILGGPSLSAPITLTDQFGTTVHDVMLMTKLATPVDKNEEGVIDSVAHQTWYEFDHAEPTRIVTAQDQIRAYDWVLGHSQFLVVPAIKNPQTGDELPKLNHYKCYQAVGPTQGIPVWLEDQFEADTLIVIQGCYFCNPVAKTVAGVTYEIQDSTAHLTCYTVNNLRQYNIQVLVWDQFIQAPVLIDRNDLICLPAVKQAVITPGSSEWRRIKALYDGSTR